MKRINRKDCTELGWFELWCIAHSFTPEQRELIWQQFNKDHKGKLSQFAFYNWWLMIPTLETSKEAEISERQFKIFQRITRDINSMIDNYLNGEKLKPASKTKIIQHLDSLTEEN